MLLMIRLGLSLLLVVTISNAQNICAVEGLARANSLDGIRAATATVRNGSLSTNMLVLQPVATVGHTRQSCFHTPRLRLRIAEPNCLARQFSWRKLEQL